jgi:hypothetical protein
LNKDRWYGVLIRLAWGSFFLGIALQQALVFSLLLLRLLDALPRSRGGPARMAPGSWAVLLALCATAFSALAFSRRQGFEGGADFLWPLIAYWAIPAQQWIRLSWRSLCWTMLLMALPGLLLSLLTLAGVSHPALPYLRGSGFLSSPAVFWQGYLICSCWALAFLQHVARKREGFALLLFLFAIGTSFYLSGNALALLLNMILLAAFLLQIFLPARVVPLAAPLLLLAGLAAIWIFGLSAMGREAWLLELQQAIGVFRDHPLLGTSHGQFGLYLSGHPAPPNLILGLPAEFGLIGCLLFLPALAVALDPWNPWRKGVELPWPTLAVRNVSLLFLLSSFFHYNIGHTSLLLFYVLHWAAWKQNLDPQLSTQVPAPEALATP